jgi:ABC-type lipoprotein release transport system permease subunit
MSRRWIERQRYLIDYTVASMRQRKGRNFILLLVYTALIFVIASLMLFSHALKWEAGRLLEGAPEIVIQKLVGGRHEPIPAGYLEELGSIRGVQEKRGRLWGYYYDNNTKANYTFMVPPDRELAVGEAVVGSGVARSQGGLAAGDALTLSIPNGEEFYLLIAGILPAESELVSADLVLVDEKTFRAIMGMPTGYYTDIALSVRNPREVYTVAAKVANELYDVRLILREEIQRTYRAIFDWREGLLLVVLMGAVFAFAILVWDKAAGLGPEERREIGILKGLGWETGEVLAMKFWEGALISLSAFLLGYGAAYWHVFAFSGGLFEPVLKGWSVLYPAFSLMPQVDLFQLVTLFFFTVFPYTAATLVPIWRVAITDPEQAMRQ